jgi:hypothetical protein
MYVIFEASQPGTPIDCTNSPDFAHTWASEYSRTGGVWIVRFLDRVIARYWGGVAVEVA